MLFIENYTVFKATCPNYEEDILAICRDGVANGISVVFSNQQMSGIGFKLMTNISFKIALYCNDRGQYSVLLDRCRLQPDEVPGRGITTFGTEIKEFQSYIAFSTGKEVERVAKIKEYIEKTNARFPDERASSVKYVPSDLSDKYIEHIYGTSGVSDNKLVIGLNYSTTAPEYLELEPGKITFISGREDLGRAKFADYCINKIASSAVTANLDLYVIDSKAKAYKKYADEGAFCYYSANEMDVTDMIDTLYKKVSDQEQADDRLKVLILAGRSVLDILKKDETACEKYTDIFNHLTAYKVCIMFTDVPNTSLTAMSNPLLKQARDAASLVFFENVRDISLISLPTQIVTSVKVKLNFSDAFYINNQKIKRMKTPLEN